MSSSFIPPLTLENQNPLTGILNQVESAGESRRFNALAPGIPEGSANNPLDRYAFGAALQAAIARAQLDQGNAQSRGLFDQPVNELLRSREAFRSGALSNSTAALAASGNAARLSGSGGNARAFAIRGAQQAATQQSAALAGAEITSSAAISQAMLARAQSLDTINTRGAQLSFQIAQLLGGIAQPGSQVAAAGVNATASKQNAIVGAVSNVLSARAGNPAAIG